MRAFGFLLHSERPLAAEIAADLAGWLRQRHHEVRFRSGAPARVEAGELALNDAEFVEGLDLLVGIGGDGTMLEAVGLAAPGGVPVLGINVGQLGYLTVVEPDAARAAVKRFLADAYLIEDRMRISATIVRVDGTREPVRSALNEVFVERSDFGHTVRIDVSFDGDPFTPYVADGVMVATPTGSTAYALSARGPIVDPRHRAQLLVPVSPHMLFDRALVLTPETVVRLAVAGNRPAHVSVDGHDVGRLSVGDAIESTVDRVPARLVRFGPPAFHQILTTKFGLSDR